jgi:integrase
MRVGELIALRWQDINLDSGSLWIAQQYDAKYKGFRGVKSHRSRRPVAVDPDLVARLRAHRVAQKVRQLAAGERWERAHRWGGKKCVEGCHGRVFTDDMGHRVTHFTLRCALNRCLEAANLEHISRHGLRHTHASLLVGLGTSMKVVQERLGHSSFAITADTYSHVAGDAQHAAAALFERGLKGETGA